MAKEAGGWMRVTVRLTGVDPDEAGAILADARITATEVAPEDDIDWDAAWRASFTPLPVGERFLIVPPWEARADPAGRIRLILDPGMAFGTGHHATTALCLTLIERGTQTTALDVGCGSGILAIAAAQLGADDVLGVDNDPAVIDIARNNVAVNGVSGRVAIREGSADTVTKSYDLVIANIFLTPLVALASTFAERVKPGGRLIVSGVRADGQAAEAAAAMTAAGFTQTDHLSRDGWSALSFRL